MGGHGPPLSWIWREPSAVRHIAARRGGLQKGIQLVVLHIESQAGALVVQQSADAADGFPRYSRDGHTVHDIGILGGNAQGGT